MNFHQIPGNFAPASSLLLDIKGNLHVAITDLSIYQNRTFIKYF